MGVQFWWFYDVIAVAAVLVCMFVTIKRGIMKAAVSLVGFAIALGVAFSLSSSLAGSLYTKVIRNSNVKKLDQSLTEGRYMDELENYLENLGYNIDIDGSQLKKICFAGENVDENIYKYVNNINSRKVEEEGIFMNKLHEGYASSLHGFITKQLSEYSAEYAAREIESSPAKFYGFFKLLSDDDNLRPAAEYIVDNYLAAPYTSEIKLIVFIVAAIFLMLITIFIETAAGKNMYEQGRREPDNTKLVELCNVFGVSVDHLLGNSGAEDNSGSVEVSEVFDEFTKKLSAQEGLMFDGVPLNNSDRMKIIDAIKVVAAIARQQHKSALGEE